MTWIKRNLYFLIACAAAVALMGWAGWNLWSEWSHNDDILAKLDEQYGKFQNLNNQKPHPGMQGGKVDNITTAQEQRKELQALLVQGTNFYQRILPIPNPESGKLTDRDFSAALSRLIDQMQHDATNASVIISPNYAFSFAAERNKVTFATNGLAPLSVQLGEVKAICDILFEAKINLLDNLRREPVSPDDASGLQTDYLEEKSITNDLAVLTPYEITFRSFSSEIASVLAGFASSPHAFVVKTISIDQASSGALSDIAAGEAPPMVQFQAPPPPPRASAPPKDPYADRYGTAPAGDRYGPSPGTAGGIQYRGLQPGSSESSRYGTPPAQPSPAATAAAASTAHTGPQIVLDEKLLKITITLDLVKLLSNQPKPAATPPKGAAPPGGASSPGVPPVASGPATTTPTGR